MLKILAWVVVTLGVIGYVCLWIIRLSTTPPFPPDQEPTGDLIAFAPPGTIKATVRVPVIRRGGLARTRSGVIAARAREFEVLRGQFVIEWPKQMTMGVPHTITARIAEHALDNFISGLKREIIKQKENIEITANMEVILQGDGTFEIIDRRAARQGIAERSYQEWTWDVVPKSWGDHKLYVRVVAVVKTFGYGEDKIDSHADDTNVHVSFSLGYFLKRLTETKAPDAVGWVLGGLIGGVGALGLQWLSRRFNRKPDKLITPASPQDPRFPPPG